MLTLQARISHLIAPRDHQRNPLSTLSKRHSTCLNLIKPSVPPNNPVDVQSLKLIDFHLLRWSAQQRLFTVLGALTSMLKTSAQLRLENLALRQQLAVLRSAPKTVETDAR